MQLEGRGNLRESERRFALTEQVQHGKRPVQGLNLVSALRGFVSHSGPPCRPLVTFLVCWDTRAMSRIGTQFLELGLDEEDFEGKPTPLQFTEGSRQAPRRLRPGRGKDSLPARAGGCRGRNSGHPTRTAPRDCHARRCAPARRPESGRRGGWWRAGER